MKISFNPVTNFNSYYGKINNIAFGTTQEELQATQEDALDIFCNKEREALGLKPDASTKEINDARIEISRAKTAKLLGLSEDATWEEIAITAFAPIIEKTSKEPCIDSDKN